MKFLHSPIRHYASLLASIVPTALLQPTALASSSELEDELFGEQPESPQAPTPSSLPTIAKEESGANPLVLGGRLELETTLNKRQKQSIGDAGLLRSGTAELYLDGRPTEGLRGFVKGAIKHTTAATPSQTVGEDLNLSLYEMWLKWGGSSSVYTTLGRQKLKWGAASFWNPTDFLAVETKDPLATFDVRPGAELLKLHFPLEKQGHNLYAVVDLNGATTANSPRIAARGEFNYGFGDFTGELTATVAAAKDKPVQFGLDLNTGLGPVDFIAEAAVTHKSSTLFYRREADSSGNMVFKSHDRSKDYIKQIVGGLRYDLKYSESDSANVSIEYFWNDAGYSDVALEAYSFIQGASRRLYLANRYLAGSLFLAQPGSFNDSNIIISALHNLTDKSWLAQTVFSHKILTRSSIEIALIKSGGAGEFTGGIPKSVAERVKSSTVLTEPANAILDAVTDAGQDWTVRIAAGIDL